MTLLRAIAILALTLSSAQGQEAKKPVDIVRTELAICVGYYTLARGCAMERSDINSATVAIANIDRLRNYAQRAGQALNMTTDQMLSLQKSVMEEQQKLLAGDCGNIEKLDDAHGLQCKQLSDNPAAVLDPYLKR